MQSRLLQFFFLLMLFPMIVVAQDPLPPLQQNCESIQVQTVDNELVITGLDLAATKARIYDDAYQLVHSCEFDCAATIAIPDVTEGAVYHLTLEFFSVNFGYLTQENIDYVIGDAPISIGLCLGNVTLANQAEVAAFCGCNIITGLLDVGDRFDGPNDINDLSNLSNISVVEDLRVTGTNLTTLAGLENLKVGRGLGIYNNEFLASIDAFNQIEVIQDVGISNNPSLRQFNAFAQLKEAQLVLSINSNNLLERFNGLEKLEIAKGFSFQNNDAFQSLDEIPNLREVGRFFSIRLNDQLRSISFADLTGDVDNLIITDNPLLENLPQIGGVNIEERLHISDNPKLINCCELFTLLDADRSNGHNAGILDLRNNGELCSSSLAIIENCSGNTPMNCDDIEIATSNNQLTISGIDAPIAIVKVFDENYQLVFECNNNCDSEIVLSDLNTCEEYTIDVQFYTENYDLICDRKFSEIVVGSPTGNLVCKRDIRLSTQAEVDAFCGCEKIEGNLLIGFQVDSDITDISNLSSIKEVTNLVSIIGTKLKDLSALNIEKVGYSLVIEGNPLLESIDGFNEVNSVQFLTIFDNAQLSTINGFQQSTTLESVTIGKNDQLNSVTGFSNLKNAYFINIFDNDALQTLTAFQGLEVSTAEVSIRRNQNLKEVLLSNLRNTAVFSIQENENLTTIEIGNKLDINASLRIIENPALSDCCFLKPLVDDDFSNGFVGRDIVIRDNGNLCNSTEEILQNCTEDPIGCENISILSENNQLTISGIDAPNAIVKVFDNNWQFAFSCNANCEEPIVLENLTAGDIYHTDIQFYDANWQFICADKQDVEIVGDNNNPCATICQGDVTLRTQAEVDAFCGCEIIEGSLAIGQTAIEEADITSLANLSQLKEVRGPVAIVRTLISDLSGLQNLSSSNNFVLAGNPNLLSLSDLANLKSIEELFILIDNPVLSETGNWSSLEQLGGLTFSKSGIRTTNFLKNLQNEQLSRIEITECANLENLAGLENITTVKGPNFPAVLIAGNNNLTDISSLRQLTLIENGLVIVRNPQLEECCAIAHLIDFDLNNGVANGLQQVEENAGNCFSNELVLETCTNTTNNFCDDVIISTDENFRSIKIANLAAPIEITKVFTENWQILYECFGDCEEEVVVQELSGDRYHIQVDMYDENWTPICDIDETVEFSTASQSRNTDLLPTNFALVPNPAQEQVQIQFAQPIEEAGHIRIYNYLGKELAFQTFEKIDNRRLAIDLANWTNGVYFVQIKTNNRRVTNKKLIVNRLY